MKTNKIEILKSFLLLSSIVVIFGCANGLPIYCIKDDSIIKISEANQIADNFINSKPGKRENYWQNPIIFGKYYVYPSSFSLFKSTALHNGVWINRTTGKIEKYNEIGQNKE